MVIYVENDTLFTITKIGQSDFKKLPLVHREEHIMQLYSSIGVADIWTSAKYPYRQFPLFTLGYPWLPCGYIIWPRLQKIIGNEGSEANLIYFDP